MPVGRWTHLALTYDSATRTAALYIDGRAGREAAIPGAHAGAAEPGQAAALLGTNDWNPLGNEVDGKIAALRISNVARTFEPPAAREAGPAGKPAGHHVPMAAAIWCPTATSSWG